MAIYLEGGWLVFICQEAISEDELRRTPLRRSSQNSLTRTFVCVRAHRTKVVILPLFWGGAMSLRRRHRALPVPTDFLTEALCLPESESGRPENVRKQRD
jgi:hypothetical protein